MLLFLLDAEGKHAFSGVWPSLEGEGVMENQRMVVRACQLAEQSKDRVVSRLKHHSDEENITKKKLFLVGIWVALLGLLAVPAPVHAQGLISGRLGIMGPLQNPLLLCYCS